MIGRLLFALVIVTPCGITACRAQPPAAAAPTAAEAQRVIETLQDPQKRAALIGDLQAIAKALPAPAAARAANAAPPKRLALLPHSLGAQLQAGLSRWADQLAGNAAAAFQTITEAPLLWHWARGTAADPARLRAVFYATRRAVVAVGIAALLEWLVRRLIARPIAALASHAPAGKTREKRENGPSETAANGEWRLLRRLPLALLRLLLDLVPIGAFWAAGSLLASTTQYELTRLAVLIVVDAYALSRAIVAFGAMLASPRVGRLRLLHVDDRQAAWLMAWLRRITAVAVFGGAMIAIAGLFGLHPRAVASLDRLVALIVAVLGGILVLRSRRGVAHRLRGPDGTGAWVRWRNGIADVWHYLALTAIAAAWMLWAAGTATAGPYGLRGIRLVLGSIAILVAARLAAIVALGTLARGFRLGRAPLPAAPGAARVARYYGTARCALALLIVAAAIIALLQFWGADAFAWFRQGSLGARLASAAATVALAAIAAIVVWEVANSRLERRLARLTANGSAGHAARLRTLLPMLRAALLAAVLAVVGLTALSQIGVNIAPLLAGAGIVGVAVGFGAQKLVQDVIGGMFVLLENAVQVGDWVTVAGLSGSVERLSVRNLWLRGADGVVHIIPFSAVSSISNSNRGRGNAAISVTLAYGEDTESVLAALREIASGMRAESEFAALILDDAQLWVDAVKAWGIVISGFIACTDAGRWAVQHEFNRRLQERLRAAGIALSDWYGVAPARPG